MVIIAINDNGKIDDDIDDQPTFRGDHDGQLAGGVHPLQGGRQCQCPHTEQNQYSTAKTMINIMVIIMLMTSCQPVSIVGGQCDPSLYHDDASLSEILKKMRLFLQFHQDIQVLVNDKRSAPALVSEKKLISLTQLSTNKKLETNQLRGQLATLE